MTGKRTIVGVDVGGTFTDLFFFEEETGAFRVAKVPSTRGDEAVGFLNGLAAGDTALAEVETIVHGTTVGTNALLERKGARVGVITTQGFRDVLEMRRRDRRTTWGLAGDFEPIVDRDLRLEVRERMLADGSVHVPLDLDEVRAATRTLIERGAEAVAVIFVNAYANPEHERAAVEAVRELWPNEHVIGSAEVLPEIREFERASTAALNAYLQPVVGAYLSKIEQRIADEGFAGKLHIVQSNGGVMAVETARRLPVRTALSGPSAGVIAAAGMAEAAGHDNVITCDLGGTSFDVSLIAGGKAALAAQSTIDFGIVIRTPMVEMTTIGAGGGSIAFVDRGGLLQVGPESAGSIPGPACYGQGGDRPTLTDANLVLGRINADRPIGGKLARLDVEAARAAIRRDVAEPLKLDVMAAAEAIITVANARMAGAIRLVSIERGHDPSRFVVMPFGGGGALHVGALIKEVGLSRGLVPPFPGVTSAMGCIMADMRHDQVQTLNAALDGLDLEALDRRMVESAREAKAVIDTAGVSFTSVAVQYEFDMHYVGQTHTVSVPMPCTLPEGGDTTGIDLAMIRTAFEETYRASFSQLLPGIPVRIVSLRTAAIGYRPKFDLAALRPTATTAATAGQREVWFDGGWRTTAIYRRGELPVGAVVEGPAILEQDDATIVIDPDLVGRVDDLGNVAIERKDAS